MTPLRAVHASWLLMALVVGVPSSAQQIAEYTEASGPLGLGYPVPVPVDTPIAFDGFRSYDGLHNRHQDLMLTSDLVTGSVVGETLDGREIWAYRIGDADEMTVSGLREPAMLTNGGLHSREWASPEVVTGIMEALVANSEDDYLHRYLLDNVNVVLLPVLNVDGYLQTQRTPGMVVTSAGTGPRDGRMRRKNMRDVDEDLQTLDDYLLGVDLNRNFEPFWGSGSGNSPNPESILYRGEAPESEPETGALIAATSLGPEDRIRMFVDVHSFGQVNYRVATANTRRNMIEQDLISDFRRFHALIPGGSSYSTVLFQPSAIGATDEFFAEIFEVPSWTLEIEPRSSATQYGGFGASGDGFILPDSEIRRVRNAMAQAFAIAYYHQAGPPTMTRARVIDPSTEAVVVDLEWDVVGAGSRLLHSEIIQALEPNREYLIWIAWNKPMRWRDDDGAVTALPGQPALGEDNGVSVEFSLEGQPAVSQFAGSQWLDQADTRGYHRYRDDAWQTRFSLDPGLADLLAGSSTDSGEIVLGVLASDLVGLVLDADPATPADWADGHWTGYEDEAGTASDTGGTDRSLTLPVTTRSQGGPFVIEPGVSAAWFDPSHDGEGFLIEILDDARAVLYWFTYETDGQQRWFISEGEVRGNELIFPDLLQARGGRFGDQFDPAEVQLSREGAASFLWSGCDSASMRHDVDQPRGRQELIRLTQLAGLPCGSVTKGAISDGISGSWFDPSHNGEGFVMEVLSTERVIMYWFTYDENGNQAWLFGDGQVTGNQVQIDHALISNGGRFGDEFDPAEVSFESWGQVSFEFDCDRASVSYQSDHPGFSSGSQQLIRLTELANLQCGP